MSVENQQKHPGRPGCCGCWKSTTGAAGITGPNSLNALTEVGSCGEFLFYFIFLRTPLLPLLLTFKSLGLLSVVCHGIPLCSSLL